MTTKDEPTNVVYSAEPEEENAEAHGRAVARTVQPLVGASGGSDAT